jgi:hypothetical protein
MHHVIQCINMLSKHFLPCKLYHLEERDANVTTQSFSAIFIQIQKTLSKQKLSKVSYPCKDPFPRRIKFSRIFTLLMMFLHFNKNMSLFF